MKSFIKEELMLENTRISDGKGNMAGYWTCSEDDAYFLLTSTCCVVCRQHNLHNTINLQ